MSSFTDIHTAKEYRLGTVKKDVANNEYIYLKGVASLAAGDAVTFDENFATTRSVASARGPVAIAMAANTSTTNYSWFQRKGLATVTVGTILADKPLYVTATAGSLDDAVVSGDKIDGAISQTANSNGQATVWVDDPVLNGNG